MDSGVSIGYHQPAQIGQCVSAVACAILYGGIELARAGVQCGIEENRIVPETAIAARRVENASVPATFDDDRRGIVHMCDQSNGTMKMRSASVVIDAAHRIEQLRDVRRGVAVLARVTRGKQAG